MQVHFLSLLHAPRDEFALTIDKQCEQQVNPSSHVMIGILTTVLTQSSSTTTSVVTSLVEAETLSVRHAIFILMGANVGTAITSTIVSLGSMRNH